MANLVQPTADDSGIEGLEQRVPSVVESTDAAGGPARPPQRAGARAPRRAASETQARP